MHYSVEALAHTLPCSFILTSLKAMRNLINGVQYYILREKGTEPAGSGQYNKFDEDGLYKCGGCGTPLYK
jgi:peptide methionine sulfoxide reductase MsrB